VVQIFKSFILVAMHSIYIPHLLRQPQATQIVYLDGPIPELETLMPVKGEVRIRHGGTFLEVWVRAETIVNLVCDRCTQSYNYRLELATTELIWLESEPEAPILAERELHWEDLSEHLPPEGHFELDTWLYEQFTLALPMQRLCGKSCQSPRPTSLSVDLSTDRRWSALEILKQQLGSP